MNPRAQDDSTRLTTHQRRLVLALLVAGAAVRLALILTADPTTRLGPYIDDAYMSHKIAMNIARGHGITQAGQPTNGFQPLFVFLLAPVYLVFNANQALTASAVMNAAFSLGCALFVFRLLRRMFNPRVGLVGMAMFLSSNFFVRVAFNGLETTLANLLMLALLDVQLAMRRAPQALSSVRAIGAGALTGLAVMARLDIALLAPLLLIDQCIVQRRAGGLRKVAAAIVAGAVILAPWFIFSAYTCHRLTPISGAATRTIAQLYASPRGPVREPEYFALGSPPASFYTGHLRIAVRHVLTDTPLSLPATVFFKNLPEYAPVWLAAIFLSAFIAHHRLPPDHPDSGRMRRLLSGLWPAWAFIAILVAVYSFWFFGSWGFWRYMTPASILLILPSALCVDALIQKAFSPRGDDTGESNVRGAAESGRRFSARQTATVAAMTAGIGLFAAAAIVGHVRLFGPINPAINEPRMLHDAIALRDMLPAEGRVAATESGILDYFLGRDVINLDGKTNAAAHAAMVGGTMDRYLEQAGVEYVLSSPPLLRDLILRRGDRVMEKLEHAATLRHFMVLRVRQEGSPLP